jgi:hypothetical protein
MTTDPGTVEKRRGGFMFGMRTLILGVNLEWVSSSTIMLLTLVKDVVTENKGLVVGLT